ncbi:hypothetical protein, partial [Micromonospora marina]|uniref:hypothetical protein n=1 Tax=Micromonospora marina TaxID=307120 RepID=UPI003D75CB71
MQPSNRQALRQTGGTSVAPVAAVRGLAVSMGCNCGSKRCTSRVVVLSYGEGWPRCEFMLKTDAEVVDVRIGGG